MNKIAEKYDFTGKRFGALYIIKRTIRPNGEKQGNYTYWLCKCDCGKEIVVSRYSLNNGKISCGCIKKPRAKETKPRKEYSNKKNIPQSLKRLRSIWSKMNRRCKDVNDNEYHNYGAKGIIVCDRWFEFNNFKDDMYEPYLEFEKINGENSATIDRINSKGNYEPSNCRWATQLEQARNRSNNISVEIEGVTYRTLSEVSEAFEIGYQTILQRYNRGLRGLKLVDRSNLVNPNVIRYTNGRVVYKDIDNNSN